MMWIILLVVALIIVFIISTYNGLVRSKIKVDNAWSQIDVQLQRRFDLIPNFVETVKGYMTHESETFEKIAKLRTSWANTSSVGEKAKLDGELSSTLKTIMAVSENYPELKANTNFADLSEELRNTENKISFSRQFYNDSVTRYNTKLELFPSNLVAGMFNFQKKELFATESDEARKNVKVDFLFSDGNGENIIVKPENKLTIPIKKKRALTRFFSSSRREKSKMIFTLLMSVLLIL